MNTKGYFYAAITIVLWSGWAVVSRLGAMQALEPLDLAFLRFTSAGLLMLPIALKNRNLITRHNWFAMATMLVGAGLGYFMFMAFGFKYAPASHSIITPCFLPVIVALISNRLFAEKFSRARIFGYAVIVLGVIFKVSISVQTGQITADLLFLMGALCWSIYTIQTKIHKIAPLVNTAFVQVGSMILIAVPYLIYQINTPHALPVMPSVIQILYQGVLTSIVSLVFYNKAIGYIGASKTSSFAALLPVLVIFLSIPILAEYPTQDDIVFASLMTVGVFFASGVVRYYKKVETTSQALL